MKVIIETIPHESQKYETVGDYWMEGDTLHIVVSELGDWKMEMLVAIHELAETLIMLSDGVPRESSTVFDKEFESARAAWPGEIFRVTGKEYGPDYEPGDSPDAPYARQHTYATAVERILAGAMNVKWYEYEQACQNA